MGLGIHIDQSVTDQNRRGWGLGAVMECLLCDIDISYLTRLLIILTRGLYEQGN